MLTPVVPKVGQLRAEGLRGISGSSISQSAMVSQPLWLRLTKVTMRQRRAWLLFWKIKNKLTTYWSSGE